MALALLFGADTLAVVSSGADPHVIPSVTAQLRDTTNPVDTAKLLDLFNKRQFAELDRLLNAYQADYENDTDKEPAAKIAFDTFFLADPDLEPQFKEWLNQFPDSYAANLASGIYYYAMAITWRGDKYAYRTHQHRFDQMQQYLEKAERHLRDSLQQTKKPVISLARLVNIAKHHGSLEEATGFLRQAVAADPDCLFPRVAYMSNLEPRWGGSSEAMQRYVEENASAGTHPKVVRVTKILRGWAFWYQGDTDFRNRDYVKALSEYEQAIASSDWGDFLVSRGWLYQRVGQTDLAIRDLTQALAQYPHHASARYVRGLALLDKQMTGEALVDLQAAANHGNTYAMNRLGDLYANGEHGVPVRIGEALRWWGKAAYFWDEGALFALGKTYERGLGVPVDQAAAVRYYRVAADEGYGPAQNDLGLMLWYGRGAPMDREEAVRLWQLAAKQDIWQARHNLNFFLDPVARFKIAVTNPRVLFDSKTLIIIGVAGGALLLGIVTAVVLRRGRTDPIPDALAGTSVQDAGGTTGITDQLQGLAGKTYRVAANRYRIFGWIIALSLFGLVIFFWRGRDAMGMTPAFLPFVVFGVYTMLTVPDIVMDQEKILLRSMIGTYRIRWIEVQRAERGSSGTLVLYGNNRRLVIPPPSRWSGPEKTSVFAALYAELSRRGIRIVPKLTADFKANKDVRI